MAYKDPKDPRIKRNRAKWYAKGGNEVIKAWKKGSGKEKVKAYDRLPNARKIHLKNGAKRRGLEWSLPDPLALDLITDHCYYCGSPANPSLGIDRVDNTRGYVEDNVVSCCATCNTMKMDMSVSAFVAHCKSIVERAA